MTVKYKMTGKMKGIGELTHVHTIVPDESNGQIRASTNAISLTLSLNELVSIT